MAETKEERLVYLLIFGQESDRWRVALKTAVATHYFISLEDLFLFLEETTCAEAHQQTNKNNATNFTNEHEFVKFV